MSAFKHIEGEYAIISQGGVYKQVDLYERDGLIYAKAAGGYVQLRYDGSTSKDKLRLQELSWEGPLHQTKFGKLCRPGAVDGSKPLDSAKKDQLLLGHTGTL